MRNNNMIKMMMMMMMMMMSVAMSVVAEAVAQDWVDLVAQAVAQAAEEAKADREAELAAKKAAWEKEKEEEMMREAPIHMKNLLNLVSIDRECRGLIAEENDLKVVEEFCVYEFNAIVELKTLYSKAIRVWSRVEEREQIINKIYRKHMRFLERKKYFMDKIKGK